MATLHALHVFLLLVAAASAQGQVWVVDEHGGADFTELQSAVAVATTGDTIFVRTGFYGPFTLSKGLTITAAEGADVVVSGFTIAGVPVSQTAVVRGVESGAIVLSANAGQVWLEEVKDQVPFATPLEGPETALTVDGCAAVILVRSSFVGHDGLCTFGCVDPSPGLAATSSQIHAYDSSFLGGDGQGALGGTGGPWAEPGAPGAQLDSTFLFLSGGEVAGGAGGSEGGDVFPCAGPADGGPGIELSGGPSQVHTLEADVHGGPGGQAGFSLCGQDGDEGPSTSGTAGTVSSFQGDALSLATSRTVPPGSVVELVLSGGPPGSPAFLGLGTGPTAVFLPVLLGTLLVEGPYDVVSLGTFDGTGGLAATISAGVLPAGDEALQLHVQAGYLSAALEVVLGAPSEITVTDASPLPKTVWTVDAAGGGDFLSFGEALANVQPGHTLLVKAGSYAGFDLAVPMTIVADKGHTVTIFASSISDISAGERVVLRGLDFIGASLLLSGNEGVVWLEEVEVSGMLLPQAGLDVADCGQVVLIRSRFYGKDAAFALGADPAPGIAAKDSELYLYDCSSEGGVGRPGVSGSASSTDAGDGAPGATLQNTRVVASGTEFLGGSGGPGASFHPLCAAPGDGGSGLRLVGSGSDVQYIDCAFLGGTPGVDATPGGSCAGATGMPGPGIEGLGAGGSVTLLSSAASLALVTSSPVQAGDGVDVQLAGPPGAPAFLALGEAPLELLVPSLSGAILVAPPYLVLPLGILDGAGSLSIHLPLLDLPPGIQAEHDFGQVGYVTSAGGVVLGAPSAVTVIEPAI
jgi:hypothetical protein